MSFVVYSLIFRVSKHGWVNELNLEDLPLTDYWYCENVKKEGEGGKKKEGEGGKRGKEERRKGEGGKKKGERKGEEEKSKASLWRRPIPVYVLTFYMSSPRPCFSSIATYDTKIRIEYHQIIRLFLKPPALSSEMVPLSFFSYTEDCARVTKDPGSSPLTFLSVAHSSFYLQ